MRDSVALLGTTLIGWLALTPGAIAHPGHANPSLLPLLHDEPLTLTWVLTGLGLALILGAAHAFSPGHGKTMAAAYLVGARSTPRHAVILALTTTLTHTLAVFGLGAIALIAAQFGWSDDIYPLLSLASGVMVLGVGVGLLRQRIISLTASSADLAHSHASDSAHPGHSHADSHHPHSHSHDHHHHHSHSHSHDDPASILALGIAGGLVPCPSALVLLLSAIALQQTVYGIALVTAFSLGLALVLVGVGLSVVYSRQWFDRVSLSPRLFRYLPIASALAMTAIGAILTVQAIA